MQCASIAKLLIPFAKEKRRKRSGESHETVDSVWVIVLTAVASS